MTFVFSTHDKMIMEKAHRVVTLKDGKVAGDEVREG
jgi:ABC-type lipoprotein export system ATPase subunit